MTSPPLTMLGSNLAPAAVARWLVGLRWAVFSVFALTLPLGDRFFGFPVRWSVAAPALALVLAVNVVAMRKERLARASDFGVAVGVGFDLVAITVVLGASGGAANPFSALFFVHVALAASLLPTRTTFLLSGLAACLFAALFFLPPPFAAATTMHHEHARHDEGSAFSTHLYGMWMAFVLAAALVAYVLTNVRRALAERQREIELLYEREHNNARFAALGTLAAGTAHELATPLGTIAVLAGELETTGAQEARAQAKAIGAEIARCREILTKMQAGARDAAPAETELGAAVERAVHAWRAAHPKAELVVDTNGASATIVPFATSELEAALCALLDNAAQASPEGGVIEVSAEGAGANVRVSVEDSGTGVAPQIEGRLGEPFLTTKEPGDGMGLGLFLVRTLVEQQGGRLEVASRSPRGTRVTLHLRTGRAHDATSGAST